MVIIALPLAPTLSGVVVIVTVRRHTVQLIQRVLDIRPTVVERAIRQNTEVLNSGVFILLD